jgi:hypothetical protein
VPPPGPIAPVSLNSPYRINLMSTRNSTHPLTGSPDDYFYSTPALSADFQFAGEADSGFEAIALVKIVLPVVPALPAQVLYASEVKGTVAINVSDINQGQIGDCFLLSSIGEIALLKPTFISNMIHVNSDGTETVTLYVASNGALPAYNTTSFKPITETVTNVFANYSVNNGTNQDVVAGQKEIWPQVLEKAVATLDSGVKLSATLNGTYSSIMNGGSPMLAMEQLTGHSASYISNVASMSLATLVSHQTAGDLIVFDTKSSGALTNGLFNCHAYMFEGVTGTGASAMVHLGNPWGFDQPTAIAFSTLSKSFVEVDVGHFA